jgi:putative peptide zinc metalloprotease protein
VARQGFFSAAKFEEAESEIAVRRKALEEAQASLRHAQADELREWRENHALARAARTEAERELERLLAGSRPEEIEAAEAEIAASRRSAAFSRTSSGGSRSALRTRA